MNQIRKSKRIFVFVDESGDPGFPGESKYFAYNTFTLSDAGLRFLSKELSAYRFYTDQYAELKEYTKNNQKLFSLIQKVTQNHTDGNCTSLLSTYFIDKNKYNGPYKANGVYFRSFILRKSLATLFKKYREANPWYSSDKSPNNLVKWEIVIDRYLDGKKKEEQERNLKRYLKKSYDIFGFEDITMVNSRYTPPIQILDVVSMYFSSIDYNYKDNILGIPLVYLGDFAEK